jgi:hypothetical protein
VQLEVRLPLPVAAPAVSTASTEQAEQTEEKAA